MMMMNRSIAAAVLALAAGLCAAQGTAASSPAKKELIQKILAHQKNAFENLGTSLAGQLSNQVGQMTAQAVSRAPADKREALANDLRSDIKKFYDEAAVIMREQSSRVAPATVGAILEEKFNEDELKTVLAWLETPVSRKFQQVAVEIQQAVSQKVANDTKPVIEPKLKALEQTVARKLNDAGVPVKAGSRSSATPASGSAPKK